DPERESDNSRKRESGALAQRTHRQAKIPSKMIQPAQRHCIAALGFGQLQAAKLAPCAPFCLLEAHALIHVDANPALKMNARLGVHLALPTAPSQRPFHMSAPILRITLSLASQQDLSATIHGRFLEFTAGTVLIR